MGDENISGDERPVHEARLDSFSVARYPVTFAEYDLFCEATGREKPEDQGWGREKRPAVNVSWADAAAYCEWLNEISGHGYRLLTEAEWEYVCRAGSKTAYFFGDDEKTLGEYAWYSVNSEGKTHPVGEKKPNAWGLHELSGNVWEWVHDWYGKYPKDAQTNPKGPDTGADRVLRGGGWGSSPRFVRSAFRIRDDPGIRLVRVGFRLARTHPQPSDDFSLLQKADGDSDVRAEQITAIE
ncbi:MAG: formylglycine-generating enzyme family protein [Gammaproteobacteria bacterium]|nr:formylglycine-generating enzyme family protein [Gammaproteobacteria bacterium]